MSKNVEPSAPLLDDEIDEDPFIKRQKEILKEFQQSFKVPNNNSNNNKTEDTPKIKIMDSNVEYYEYLKKKKETESEDEKFAKLLQESENNPIRKENPKDDFLVALELSKQYEQKQNQKKEHLDDDETLARLLHEEELRNIKDEEDRKKKLKEDEEIARRVYEEDMIKAKEEERKRKHKQDEEFAKKLLEQERSEQERIRDLTEKDTEIARLMYEEELRKKKEEEETLNWEKTMNMIKDEVRTDYDSEMSRVLREKEELERKLDNLKYRNNGNIVYPNYWALQYEDNTYYLFNVPQYTNEWYTVSAAFQRSMRNQISKIERIQNKALWNFFSMKKNTMDSKSGSNERYLFHGSKTNAYDLIIRDGFDHRVSNLNGALGAGIYFAAEASTSSSFVKGYNKRMLYCRVLLGSCGPGSNGLRRPPNKPGSNELYDSVHQTNTIFALFDNTQAYPEYVIYYY